MIIVHMHGLWCVPINFLVFDWLQFYLAYLVRWDAPGSREAFIGERGP
jgi:hypothetical protein